MEEEGGEGEGVDGGCGVGVALWKVAVENGFVRGCESVEFAMIFLRDFGED